MVDWYMISVWNIVQLITDNWTEVFLLRSSSISDIEHAFMFYILYNIRNIKLNKSWNTCDRNKEIIITKIAQQIAKMLKLYAWTRNGFNQIIFGTKCICGLLLIIKALK